MVCKVDPMGPCEYCQKSKLKCSLMPAHPDGWANHEKKSAEAVCQFHISQLNSGKGKMPARPSADEEAKISPLTTLGPLMQMTLNSTLSPADTTASSFPKPPINSPAPGPAFATPKNPAATWTSVCSANASVLTSDFYIDIPSTSAAVPGHPPWWA